MSRHLKAETLVQMFELRRNGASYPYLGRLFHKHHTTIIWHCKKNHVVPLVKVRISRLEHPDIIPDVRTIPIGEIPMSFLEEAMMPIYMEEGANPGKRYDEYIAEAYKKDKHTRHYFDRYKYDPTKHKQA